MFLNNPEYAKVGDKKYKINTDFRVAIECDNIARDSSIDDYERPLAIIYKLFGDEGLDNPQDYETLLNIAKKYLSCGKEKEVESDDKPDMDFEEDMDYIEASFMSDYNIDLTNTKMHWWTFLNLINGLSNSEIGNCCVLNRIRNLRNLDINEIKDEKERKRIIKAKKSIELKKFKKENNLTKEQEESIKQLNELLNIGKE